MALLEQCLREMDPSPLRPKSTAIPKGTHGTDTHSSTGGTATHPGTGGIATSPGSGGIPTRPGSGTIPTVSGSVAIPTYSGSGAIPTRPGTDTHAVSTPRWTGAADTRAVSELSSQPLGEPAKRRPMTVTTTASSDSKQWTEPWNRALLKLAIRRSKGFTPDKLFVPVLLAEIDPECNSRRMKKMASNALRNFASKKNTRILDNM